MFEKRFLLEDMMSRVSVCVVIILHIGGVIAFTWKNVSRKIIACEHEEISIHWEYDLTPGEYVKAKTWFTGFNKTARRIAYWKDTDGLTIESQYKDRVTITGNNSLILRAVRTYDEGPYTLIPNFPLSSEPDPRLTVDLIVFISPLKEPGCCKPDINATLGELRPFLHSTLACGKPTPTLTWTITRNKTVLNDNLLLGTENKDGTYKVCVTGPAVDRCFTADKEYLCKSITVESSLPGREEVKSHVSNETIIGVSVVVVAITIVGAVLTAIILYRRARRKIPIPEEQMELIKVGKSVSGVKFLTDHLVSFYETKVPSSTEDVSLRYRMVIRDHSDPQLHDSWECVAPSYENMLCTTKNVLNRILLQGEAGCGKKTWSNSFIRSWCKAHSLDSNGQADENTRFLCRFKLLFNVLLSNVEKETNINELLRRQHIPKGLEEQCDVYKYLEKKSDVGLIFLIQGLDEYTGNAEVVKELLTSESLRDALVIFTSRPLNWSSVEKRFDQVLPLDRTITIKGLDENDIKTHVNEILKKDGYPQHSMEQFFALVDKMELGAFKHEPIFSPILIEMWQKSNTLPSSKAEFLLNVLEHLIKKKRDSFLRRFRDNNEYRFDFANNPVFMGKVFIGHYGQILLSLGKIACVLQREEEKLFDSQKFEDENNRNFIVLFCVNVDLIIRSQDNEIESKETTFSFRHRSMQLFLAALYYVFKPISERKKEILATRSGADGENLSDSRNSETAEYLEYVSYLSAPHT